MAEQYRLSPLARLGWLGALASLPVISVGAMFTLTDDTLVLGENSPLVHRYVGSATEPATSSVEVPLASRFGRPGGASTLVLYDHDGDYAEDAEMYAIAAANLATHFGEVEIAAIADYAIGSMAEFDAVVYLGTQAASTLPQAFVNDVREEAAPVLWVEGNIDELAETAVGVSDFTEQYGWDPLEPRAVSSALVEAVEYRDRHVQRRPGGSDVLYSPRVVDAAAVEVVADAVCGNSDGPVSCDPDSSQQVTEVPWAVRSKNLTYVAEVPLDYIDENDIYLIFADLYYDLLAPGTVPIRQAAVRLEDVGPEADPKQLRAVADYLAEQGVPFQVAVMPIHIDRTPDKDGWYGLSLGDTPAVVDALKYMQERGGTLIQHGTTHQFGALDNPYSGRTGEDYEFYQYGCTDDQRPPYDFGECRTDSHIRMTGPVAEDSVEQHIARLEHGRQVMVEAGLGAATIFETPHYAGSVNAYLAMAEVFDARYEQSEYFAGIVSGREITPEYSYSQHFPYKVQDIYGSTVYPENLGNITETEQNNHAVRDPEFLIDRAEANLVVRESTASFFFHPYLDMEYLRKTVEGIRDLGYTFVPVHELR